MPPLLGALIRKVGVRCGTLRSVSGMWLLGVKVVRPGPDSNYHGRVADLWSNGADCLFISVQSRANLKNKGGGLQQY